MPCLPLHRKLLEELDDVDRSFKHAQLSKYLQDVSIEPFFITPAASDADSDDSRISSISSLSGISSISSISSLGSGDEAFLKLALLLSPSGFEEMYTFTAQAKINKLHHKIITLRVLHHNPAIKKVLQLHLLEHWRDGNLDQYRRRVCVDPNTFDGIIKKICNHKIFHNNSNVPQAPVEVQLAIFLF
jgi:hypothetical protein